jgi:hypothetical protein
MAQARTALDHLLDARAVLVDEAQRLAASLADLESLIGSMGGADRLDDADGTSHGSNPVKAAAVASARTATRSTARKSVSRRSATRRPPTRSAGSGEAPKSIRVHVLEMLAADNRDFSLAEIIDQVHDAGIQAHDDAVRSITIKLMKDGRVERVGRGQYRLARRGGANRPADEASVEAPVDETPAESTAVESTAVDSSAESTEEPTAAGPPDGTLDYSPPLNLNEPWGSGQD